MYIAVYFVADILGECLSWKKYVTFDFESPLRRSDVHKITKNAVANLPSSK